jgi:hypothetical protein
MIFVDAGTCMHVSSNHHGAPHWHVLRDGNRHPHKFRVAIVSTFSSLVLE